MGPPQSLLCHTQGKMPMQSHHVVDHITETWIQGCRSISRTCCTLITQLREEDICEQLGHAKLSPAPQTQGCCDWVCMGKKAVTYNNAQNMAMAAHIIVQSTAICRKQHKTVQQGTDCKSGCTKMKKKLRAKRLGLAEQNSNVRALRTV